MIDTGIINRGVDLLHFVAQDVALKHKASTNGGEYAGPCPFCGGRDRFLVWPNADPPAFWCRQCNRSGDALAYAMQRYGLDFLTACDFLVERGPRRGDSAAHPQQASAFGQGSKEPPGPGWQEQAQAVMTDCQKALWSDLGAKARIWLERERGLSAVTLRTWGIGYCPKDGTYNGLFVHRGIVIPWLAGGHVWKLQVRRPTTSQKERYKQVGGAAKTCPGLFGVDKLTGNTHCVVTEGEFDAMLVWQEGRGLVDVLTLGNAGGRLDDRWLPVLLPIQRFWVSTDSDEAGQKAAAYWLDLTGERGRRVFPPTGAKDVGDAWRDGADLRMWLLNTMSWDSGQASDGDSSVSSGNGGHILDRSDSNASWASELESGLRARLPGVQVELNYVESDPTSESAPAFSRGTMKLTELSDFTKRWGLRIARVEWPAEEPFPTFHFERNS